MKGCCTLEWMCLNTKGELKVVRMEYGINNQQNKNVSAIYIFYYKAPNIETAHNAPIYNSDLI